MKCGGFAAIFPHWCRKNVADFSCSCGTVSKGSVAEHMSLGPVVYRVCGLSLGSEKMKKILLAASAMAMLTGVAMAAGENADATRENYFKAGKHQIYVWCTGGKGDKSVAVDGANGEDAIKKAAAAEGATCWGNWQGMAK